MDCRATLETLEIVRPDALDPREPGLAEAAAHLAGCPRCRAVLDDREALDQTIVHVMQDVPVPAGLKDKLLAAVAVPSIPQAIEAVIEESSAASSAAEAPLPASRPPAPASRRTWLWAAASTLAACLLVGVGVWQFGYLNAAPMSLEQVRKSATLNVAALPAFDQNFEVELPGFGWTASSRVSVADPPKGAVPVGASQQLAVFAFRFRTGNGSFVDGALLVVPAVRVSDPPPAGSFDSGKVEYVHAAEGKFPTVAWTEANLVYVCVVPESAAGRLNDLHKELRRSGLT